MCVHMSAKMVEAREGLIALGTGVSDGHEHSVLVLGTPLRESCRAAGALNHWAIFPATVKTFLNTHLANSAGTHHSSVLPTF